MAIGVYDPKYVVSIHAPWEGCDEKERILNRLQRVSIHAPWEGCDTNVQTQDAF